MANRMLFRSTPGALLPRPDAVNEAGAPAYALPPRQMLAQYAATGCLNDTFYASADEQLEAVLRVCGGLEPEFIARTAVYAREAGGMKDLPALLCAVLAVRSPRLLERVFGRVVDSPRMLRTFVQIVRSGAAGRKSLGTVPKRLLRGWLESRTDEQLFRASVGGDPSLADIVRMVHPKPDTASRAALYGYLLGRPHRAEDLPQLVRDYEDFKAGRTEAVPAVPIEMLTSLPLTAKQWLGIARRASWQATRMNLNTFARHGVFGEVPQEAEPAEWRGGSVTSREKTPEWALPLDLWLLMGIEEWLPADTPGCQSNLACHGIEERLPLGWITPPTAWIRPRRAQTVVACNAPTETVNVTPAEPSAEVAAENPAGAPAETPAGKTSADPEIEEVSRIIADRLRDPRALVAARALPHQLLATWGSVDPIVPDNVREALAEAMESVLARVPAIAGKVYVCPDVSGSMSSAATGHRAGATSAVRCIDVAALFAVAMLRRNPEAEVIPFEQDVVDLELDPEGSVMANAARLAAIGGGGTNCSAPLALLNRGSAIGDLVVIVSDNQSWVDISSGFGTELMIQWEIFRARNPRARLVCIDIQPHGTTQASEREDILNVGGFSDRVFEVVGRFADGILAADHWVGVIGEVEL